MFSLVFPMDTNRLEQFKVTKRAYDAMPQEKEFVIPTRSLAEVSRYLEDNELMAGVRLVPYEWEAGFNPSMGFNIGVRNAKYDQIIITSPEVKPSPDVLDRLEARIGQNVLCQVADEDVEGNLSALVDTGYRNTSPAMYFLAMFNKKDIELINGWDEDFMKGYAYEDDDFGERFNRAGLKYVFDEEIRATHQYHPRSETISGGAGTNKSKLDDNNNKGVIRPQNGLIKESQA